MAKVPAGQSDKVKVQVESADIDPKKIRFETGITPQPTEHTTENELTVRVTGTAHGMTEELLAYYDKGEEEMTSTKPQVIGKLNIVSYDPIRPRLVLVQVNNNRYPYTATLTEKLNNIFRQAVAEWTVEEPLNLQVDLGKEFDDGESGLLSNYTGDMKKVINTFLRQNTIEANTYYLFLVSNPKSGIKTGYMPRKKQAGFIFVDKLGDEDQVVKIIAHELAHGAFRLEHTFSEHPGLPERSTDNLMDYGTGTRLYKYQWDRVHNPEAVLGLFEGDEEGAYIYGITWLGNYFWGLAPDDQESQVEKDRALFKYIYENYDRYFNDSKAKDVNLETEAYNSWSVRKASHRGIAKKVFKGIKEDKVSLSLYNEGIYFEEYILEEMTYKVAIYSRIETVSLNQDIRIKSFKALRNNKFIKIGYAKDYGLIAFYDAGGNIQMVLQVIGGNTSKDAVIRWVNYLGLLLPSEEQRQDDNENLIQEMFKFVPLYPFEKLKEIWGEKEEEQKKSEIDVALIEMEEFLGNPYSFGGGDSRNSLDEKGTKEMDCSEFVARFIQKASGLEEVPNPFYTSLMLSSMQDGSFDNFLQHVKNSEKEDFKDIRPGDVFLWSKSPSEGHTGVVVSYDKETDKVMVIEAIGSSGAAEESLSKDLEGYCQGCIRKSMYTRTGKALYKHKGWMGYFRVVTTKQQQ